MVITCSCDTLWGIHLPRHHPKDAFHHNVGALRAIVEPAFIKKTLIPYEEMLKHGSFIKDRVVSCNISRKTVTLW